MGETVLQELAEQLLQVDDISWGMFAFSRDILGNRINRAEKKEMILKAMRCGQEKAEEIIKFMGISDPWELAEKWKLNVEYLDRGQTADRVLFALFTPPDRIQIMKEPIKRAAGNGMFNDLITEEQMVKLILGHEIFHYLEEEDEDIYTRKEKIVLWKLFGYENKSSVRALSEIAGMYFSKKINEFSYSPFALDILLYYNYNPDEALRMYRELLSF